MKLDQSMADTILSLEMDAENARSFVQDVDGWSPQVLTRYVRFCTDSAEALTLLLHPREIDRAILGETHWRIRGLERPALCGPSVPRGIVANHVHSI